MSYDTSVSSLVLLAVLLMSQLFLVRLFYHLLTSRLFTDDICSGYMQNNVTGHTKRAFASAITIGGGGIGGIIASTVFRSKDAPGYRPGRK